MTAPIHGQEKYCLLSHEVARPKISLGVIFLTRRFVVKISRNKLMVNGLVISAVSLYGCGKKKKDDEASSAPPYVAALALGSDAMGYGIKVLASSNKTSPSASLTENMNGVEISDLGAPRANLTAEAQDPDLPDCSNNGAPWDKTTNARMQISNSKFSETTFYCQINSKQSPETLAGTLSQYKAVLCDVEKTLGTVEYTADGKAYADQAIKLTEACGWSSNTLSQMPNGISGATITAYAISTGDWQKRIRIQVPALQMDYNIYYTIKSDTVAFKAVETWSQADRISGGDYNSNIASSATGTRGSIISIDITNATLRAESADTYWSRRFRFFMKGTLDGTTGEFASITDGQGVVANFDYQTGLYGEIATAKGNSSDGYLHGNYQFSCSSGCTTDARANTILSSSSTSCSSSGGCSGMTPISFSAVTADFDYLMIGAAWDTQTGKRTNVQDWLSSAGILTMSSVGKDVTL